MPPKIAKAIHQTEEDILNKSRDCTITKSHHENATENQNLILHLKEYNTIVQQLLVENKDLSKANPLLLNFNN